MDRKIFPLPKNSKILEKPIKSYITRPKKGDSNIIWPAACYFFSGIGRTSYAQKQIVICRN